jgi:hypothetical protein
MEEFKHQNKYLNKEYDIGVHTLMPESKTTITVTEKLRNELKILATYQNTLYENILCDMVLIYKNTIPFNSVKEFGKWFETNLSKFNLDRIKEIEVKNNKLVYKVDDMYGKEKKFYLTLVFSENDKMVIDNSYDAILCVFSIEDSYKNVPIYKYKAVLNSPVEEVRIDKNFKKVRKNETKV